VFTSHRCIYSFFHLSILLTSFCDFPQILHVGSSYGIFQIASFLSDVIYIHGPTVPLAPPSEYLFVFATKDQKINFIISLAIMLGDFISGS
jgi:hypothetical protein